MIKKEENVKENEILQKLEEVLLAQKGVLTLDEVVRYTGKSKSQIYKLTSSREIPFYKNGKNLYFKRTEIEDWLIQYRIKPIQEIEKDASRYIVLNPNIGRVKYA